MTDVPEWARTRFERHIAPTLFTDVASSPNPPLILIGGQPGAGKTHAQVAALAMHRGESVVPIIGDDLRIYHPDYDRLMRDDPTRMPEVTAPVSAWWVEASLNHACEHKYGVLVEGTFRRPGVTINTAARFHAAGYDVHMIAVAVAPWESRLSTLERFVTDHAAGRAARWTDVAAHDAGVAGTPRTLSAAAATGDVQRLTVINRSGTVLFDSTGEAPRTRAAAALLREHRRTPSAREFTDWGSRLHASKVYLEANVPASTETRALLRALQRDSTAIAGQLAAARSFGRDRAQERGQTR